MILLSESTCTQAKVCQSVAAKSRARRCAGSEKTPQAGRLLQQEQPADNMSVQPGKCSHTTFWWIIAPSSGSVCWCLKRNQTAGLGMPAALVVSFRTLYVPAAAKLHACWLHAVPGSIT